MTRPMYSFSFCALFNYIHIVAIFLTRFFGFVVSFNCFCFNAQVLHPFCMRSTFPIVIYMYNLNCTCFFVWWSLLRQKLRLSKTRIIIISDAFAQYVLVYNDNCSNLLILESSLFNGLVRKC